LTLIEDTGVAIDLFASSVVEDLDGDCVYFEFVSDGYLGSGIEDVDRRGFENNIINTIMRVFGNNGCEDLIHGFAVDAAFGSHFEHDWFAFAYLLGSGFIRGEFDRRDFGQTDRDQYGSREEDFF
jgi:hypothetical protein